MKRLMLFGICLMLLAKNCILALCQVSNSCSNFTDVEYKALYDLRLKNSNFNVISRDFLIDFVKNNTRFNKSYSFLSIGPGDGKIEIQLLNPLIHWHSIDFVEPNKQYANVLKSYFKGYNVSIIQNDFDPSLLTRTYDFILMNQVTHLLNNPVQKVRNSLNHLNSNGHMIIILHSDYGMQFFRKKYLKKYKALFSPHFITGEILSKRLKAHNVMHKIYILDCYLNMQVCSNISNKCNNLINFVFLYNFNSCNQVYVAKEIHANFLKHSLPVLDNSQIFLSEPMMAILISKTDIFV